MSPQGLDQRFMRSAIRLSMRHRGKTGANPSVGAVLVQHQGKGARIIGAGVTALGGRPHAETEAIKHAVEDVAGATLYVTLEPCSHTGKTLPCTSAIITSKIARVVVACKDPDPRVCGKGIEQLQAAGIEVVCGVEEAYASSVLEDYLFHRFHHRPRITLKMALSQEGIIGQRGAGSVKISGPLAQKRVHVLRAQSDAILVGIGTVLEDNPLLTCRLPGWASFSPVRVVIDPFLAIPLEAALVATAKEVPLVLFSYPDVDARKKQALHSCGATLYSLPDNKSMGIDYKYIAKILGHSGIKALLVEGGAKTAQGFLEQDLIDCLICIKSPISLPQGDILSPDFSQFMKRYTQLDSCFYGVDRYDVFSRSSECLQEL